MFARFLLHSMSKKYDNSVCFCFGKLFATFFAGRTDMTIRWTCSFFECVCVCVELKTKLSEINFRQVITFNQANNFFMFLIKMQLKSCVIIFGWWVENLTAINPINAIAFLLLLNQIHKILNLPRKWYWRNVPLIQHCQFILPTEYRRSTQKEWKNEKKNTLKIVFVHNRELNWYEK